MERLDYRYKEEICGGFFYRSNPMFSSKFFLREALIELLSLKISFEAPILDYGCGTGQFLYYLWAHGFRNLEGRDWNERWLIAGRVIFSELSDEKPATFTKTDKDDIYNISGKFQVITLF